MGKLDGKVALISGGAKGQGAAEAAAFAREGANVVFGDVRDEDGKKRYEWHDGQVAVRHHLKAVKTAAKYGISINAHEPVKDTGLRRTYPNWLSREGVRGQAGQSRRGGSLEATTQRQCARAGR